MVYFVGAVGAIVVGINLVAVGVVDLISQYQTVTKASVGMDAAPGRGGVWQPDVIAIATIATLAVIVGGSLFKIAQLWRGGRAVAELMGATPVPPNGGDPQYKLLRDVVEEMAIASGVAVPGIYVMEGETGINAFAAGLSRQDAVVCVTRGALDRLSRDQLQGVIAHEFSHILNADIRLNLKLVGALFGIFVIGLVGYGMIRAAWSGSSSDNDDWRGAIVLSIIGLALMTLGFMGFFFGRLIQAAVCRQREFLADASAVQFTRHPGGLAGALKLIGARESQSRIGDSDSEQIAHMFFASSMGRESGWLATHPPPAARISRLEAGWDGKFPAAPEVQGRYVSGEGVPLNAAGVAASVGVVTPRHVRWASETLGAIPPVINDAARDPFSARALVFAILLSDQPEVRANQVAVLKSSCDAPTVDATLKLAGPVAEMGPAGRRVLVDLAMPALRHMSGPQCEQFGNAVDSLVDADNRISLFEYMLTRMLNKGVLPKAAPAPPVVAYPAMRPLAGDAGILLSALATADGKAAGAARAAFDAGVRRLQLDQPLAMAAAPGVAQIDAALDRISRASPAIKRRVVEACAFTVAQDGVVQAEEGELLRAVTTALDCPLPPLVEEGVGVGT